MSALRRAAEVELVDEATLPELDCEPLDLPVLLPVAEAEEPEAEPVAPRSSV